MVQENLGNIQTLVPGKRLDGENKKEWVGNETVTGRNGTGGSALCPWSEE